MTRPSLPRLDPDPDGRLVRWGWIVWIGATAALAVRFSYMGRDASPLALVTALPAVALWLSWPLWRGGRALWHALRTAPYRPWTGSYYESDGRRVRVLFDDDAIFVVAADVHAVLGLAGHATAPGRVRAVAGRDGLVRVDGVRDDVFTERGLAAWLQRRTDRRSVSFRRWFETQVIAPHRRRRER